MTEIDLLQFHKRYCKKCDSEIKVILRSGSIHRDFVCPKCGNVKEAIIKIGVRDK